jgi:hypothetical protein
LLRAQGRVQVFTGRMPDKNELELIYALDVYKYLPTGMSD